MFFTYLQTNFTRRQLVCAKIWGRYTHCRGKEMLGIIIISYHPYVSLMWINKNLYAYIIIEIIFFNDIRVCLYYLGIYILLRVDYTIGCGFLDQLLVVYDLQCHIDIIFYQNNNSKKV